LYIGILCGEWPQNFLLQKLPLAKMLSVNVFIWGAVVACSAASNNFASLMTVRFLLGYFESCIQPAMMLLSVAHALSHKLLLNMIQDFDVVHPRGTVASELPLVLHVWCATHGEWFDLAPM
jgi:MFS family permease